MQRAGRNRVFRFNLNFEFCIIETHFFRIMQLHRTNVDNNILCI